MKEYAILRSVQPLQNVSRNLYIGRWSTRQRPFFKHTSATHMNFAHKYTIFMKGDTLDEMAEEALHFAYLYVMRALQEHRIQGRNGEYEAFALELLAMLQKHLYLYTNPPEAPAPF